jgi:hypothetical protein
VDAGINLLLDVPHRSISALSLGKKSSGETLRIAASETEIEISRLGHGEGHGIATSFRYIRHEQARSQRPPCALK